MTYRIGIYDPAFRSEGHFITFNRYVRKILDTPDIEVTFIDRDGSVEAAYRNYFDHKTSYLRIPDAPKIWFLPGRLGRIVSRLLYWRAFAKTVKQQAFDLVLFTADPRDPVMTMVRFGFPYGVIILYPFSFAAGSKLVFRCYKRFVQHARIRITTNEPDIRARIEALLEVENIHWIPDLPVEAQDAHAGGEDAFEFLTIGTISKNKNHVFVLNVFEDRSIPYSYLVAGRSQDETGTAVEKKVQALSEKEGLSIMGRFDYLPEDEYMDLMRQASFLIFPYDFTRGDISSQVLHDSFSTRTPFIAPDIEPFRWYEEKYKIGLLYKEGDAESCAQAIRNAHEQEPEKFLEGFEKLSRDHSLAAIRDRFLSALVPVLGK